MFAERRGVVVNDAADRLVKAAKLHAPDVWDRLMRAELLTLDTAERLRRRETRLPEVYRDDVKVPGAWSQGGRDVPSELAQKLSKASEHGFAASQRTVILKLIDGLCGFFDITYGGGVLKEVKIGQERKLQDALRNHLRSAGYKVVEAQRIAGGQEDLLFEDSITIENKIHSEETDSPLEAGANYPYQARRYSIPTSSEVVATVIGYKPKSEHGHRMGRDSIDIRRLKNGETVEIRLAVPLSYTSPSAARAP